MGRFWGRKFGYVLLMAVLVWPASVSVAARESGAGDMVYLVVELVDTDDRELRREVRSIRRMSDRPPRSYTTSWGIRRARDLRRWRVVEVAAEEAEVKLQELRNNPAVVSARREVIYYTAAIPNDPRYDQQYGLGDSAGFGINAPAAWEVTTGSSDTIIAIIDGGFDLEHEDLRNKVWRNGGEIAGNGIDDDGNGRVDDVNGWDFVSDRPAGAAIDHGTHVAAAAAADSNNGIGVAGVDWRARLMSVRVLSRSGTGREENIIRGIQYAVDNGADIINMSIVGRESEALLAAVEDAYLAGVVVVAAAGNTRTDTGRYPIYPACAEANGVNMVLGVGATDDDGEPASFSSYGDCVDVSAPGDKMWSAKMGNRYGKMSGTSMASPLAAGAAGLYIAENPGAAPAEVIAALKKVDALVGKDAEETREWNEKYKGRLNVAAALGAAEVVSVPVLVEDIGNEGEPVVAPSSSPAPIPNPVPVAGPEPSSGGDSGGGGDDSGGGGGGGDEGDCCAQDDEQSFVAVKNSRVKGVKKVMTRLLANKALIPKINSAFRSVFGRNPLVVEHSYWLGRINRGEKRSFGALVGAMAWQKAAGKTYDPTPRVLGARTRVIGQARGNLVPRINSIHRGVYGRNPSASEHAYWLGRVMNKDKKTAIALRGAMLWHKLAGIRH